MVHKLSCDFTHALNMSYTILYIGFTHPLVLGSDDSDSSLRKTLKVILKVMKHVGPYRNIKHVALFSQADTNFISSRQIISGCQGHSYKSLLLL